MNIGIDIRTLMDAKYSGVSLFTLELVKAILKIDQTNHYKLFYNSASDMSGRIPDFDANNAEVVYTRWPNKIFNYFMQKALNQPKIDSLLGVDLFFMPHLNFISLSGNCRKIITIHDLSFLRYPEFFSVRKNFWHRLINVKKLLRSFDTVVAVSENTKKDIVELVGIDPDKIKLIYPGSSEKYRRVTDKLRLNEVKEKYGLPEKFILFLSTIEPRKNVDGIIRAYEQARCENKDLENYHLVLAGASGWKSYKTFGYLAKSHFREKIKLIGYVAEADKPALYSLAGLFIYPSFYEGFGFPPLEALACGCLSIIGNSSSLPEVVRDKAIMVNPYDISEIKQVIGLILNDSHWREIFKQKIGSIADDFSWGKTAGRYLDIFNNIK